MIRNPHILNKFNRDWLRRRPADYQENVIRFQRMYDYACELGALPPKNLLQGIETNIKLAKVINSNLPKCRKSNC